VGDNRATAAILVLLFLTDIATASTLTGQADIVDADTNKIGGISVRLYGIDAPEDRQTCEVEGKRYSCGKRATHALAMLIGGKSVLCEIVGKDDYARALGACTVGDTQLNRTMVLNGWALAFVKYSDKYVADQSFATASKAGLWAGSFVKP
jgi:endonuclease YncB( thermonuclease family)